MRKESAMARETVFTTSFVRLVSAPEELRMATITSNTLAVDCSAYIVGLRECGSSCPVTNSISCPFSACVNRHIVLQEKVCNEKGGAPHTASVSCSQLHALDCGLFDDIPHAEPREAVFDWSGSIMAVHTLCMTWWVHMTSSVGSMTNYWWPKVGPVLT